MSTRKSRQNQEQPRKPGRPATGRKRSVQVKVWVTPNERDEMQRAADADGLTLGEWMLRQMLRLARRKK